MREFKKEVILTNEMLKRYYTELVDSATRLINKEIPNLSYPLFSQYFKTGHRLAYETIYFLRREYLVTFAMLSFIEENERYLTKLEEVIWLLCDEYTWALPAHIGQDEWNEETRYVLDLFSCETAAALAEIVTLLEGKLSPTVINRAKQEIFNRVIYTFKNRRKPFDWENYRNNWCAVCAGSIGIATLYLVDDVSIAMQIVSELKPILKNYLDSFEEDGTCLEGLSYWTYGMSYYVAFADLLKIKTNEKFDWLKGERLEKIAQFQHKCYFEKGRTVSFSDGSDSDLFRIGLSHYLSNHFESVYIPYLESAMGYHSDHCYRFTPIFRDFIWTMSCNPQKQVSKGCTSYSLEQAQWLICQSHHGSQMAIKGGTNDEPHNHNDVGTFIYNHRGVVLVADLGAGEYTRDYFNENRYTIFCNQSFSHSVPIINGAGQKNGSSYRASECLFENDFEMQLEFSEAYDLVDLKQLYRRIWMDKQTGSLTLKDQFEFEDTGNEIIERFITKIHPMIEDHQVILKQSNIIGNIICKNSDVQPIITTHEHVNHMGKRETIYLIDYHFVNQVLKSTCLFIIHAEEMGEGYESI